MNLFNIMVFIRDLKNIVKIASYDSYFRFRIRCIMLILEKFNDLEAQGYEACLLKKIHLNVTTL